MNIFRELVEELKDENLLEETVSESGQEGFHSVGALDEAPDETAADIQTTNTSLDELDDDDIGDPSSYEKEESDGPSQDSAADEFREAFNSAESELDSDKTKAESPDVSADTGQVSDVSHTKTESIVDPAPVDKVPLAEWDDQSEAIANAAKAAANPSKAEKVRTLEEEKKFFRQRAMDEVIGLQLVEHVLSGVEREQMKSSPKTFDDLAVKRALHDFLKVADDLNSPEHSKAEFQLMQETENWCSSLSRRDRNISVAHLRRYCETTKPSLSSQALISLARFYRNSPYSEAVRSKFDLVFTKLFSKEQGGELRTVVFKNGELIKHIQELYADWSSIPLYSTDEEDSELLLAALKFQDFINEAEVAESFDELVRKDFFKRLKVFKEKSNENFFAPLVVAAAIESNVAVGNRYVELIEMERQRSAGKDIGERYGVVHDSAISEATSKTLELLDILQSKKPEPVKASKPVEPRPAPNVKEEAAVEEPEQEPVRFTVRGGANQWLIVATVVVVAVTAWLFLQGSLNVQTPTPVSTASAKVFEVSGTPLGKYVHSARVARNTIFGITRPAWNNLSDEEKNAMVQETLKMGKGNGFEKVQFLNSEGKSMAFGSKSKITVY